MSPEEIVLIKEALELMDAGLSKLMTIETAHPTLSVLLDKLQSATHLAEKLIGFYESV